MDFTKSHFDIDFFSILHGEVHIFGTLWKDCEDIHEVVYKFAIVPIFEFVRKYKESGMDYVNDLLGGVQQYESDNLTEEDAEDIFSHYYNGVSPEGELDYSEIAINTPEGNYFTSNI